MSYGDAKLALELRNQPKLMLVVAVFGVQNDDSMLVCQDFRAHL